MRLVLAVPKSIRFPIYASFVRAAVALKDEELKALTENMAKLAIDFNPTQAAKFAEMRIVGLLRVSKEQASRMVKSMLPAVKALSLKEYARQQAAFQRATLKLSKADQMKLASLIEPIASTGFLPVEVAGAYQKEMAAKPTAAPAKPAPAPGQHLIPFEELRDWIKAGKKFVLLDVLTQENFETGHIPGSINLPAEQIEKVHGMFKKDDTVVLYCRDASCVLSSRCAQYMQEQGFTNVYHYRGGKLEWLMKGEPLATKDGRPGTCMEGSCIIV